MIDTPSDPCSVIVRFNDALNARDVNALMRLMTEDCVFENTYPPPAGTRYVGQAAVRSFWEDFMRESTEVRFEIEEIFSVNDRGVMRWTYHWIDPQGNAGHIRGVDVYTVRGGLITEKLSYVKG
jgi:ketosteroid isomerase-like protein